MTAFENLTAALNANAAANTALAAAIDNVVAEWHKPNPTDEQIQGAADQLTAQTAQTAAATQRLTELLSPPVPAGG